jgi:hypothetical protein
MPTGLEPSLARIRWAVRAILWLAIVVSIAANILDAQRNGISQAIHAWPPLALFLAVELISRVPVARHALVVARAGAGVSIALIAAWISYWHMVKVAHAYGEVASSAHLLPFTVDALIVVASICLVELGARMRATRDARDVIAHAEEITRIGAELDAARADARTARTAHAEESARRADADNAARRAVDRADAARAELDALRAARADEDTARTRAPRGARSARADEDARRAHFRALRAAHADESTPRVLMRWDVSAHGAPPAARTAQDWAREDNAARPARDARPRPTGSTDARDGAQ